MRHVPLLLLLALPIFSATPNIPPAGTPSLIEVDDAGNGYVAGDNFVMKYRLDNGAVVYQATLTNAFVRAIAIDSTGALYATGFGNTTSTISGVEFKAISGTTGTIVTKLDAVGNVSYATMIGPSQPAADIAVNPAGEAYVTGEVLEGEMPATPGAAVSQGGITRTNFVAKLNAAGDRLLLVERGIGGSKIAFDAAGNIYVAGTSGGKQDPPITPNAFQRTHETRGCGGGGFIGFGCDYQHIAKLDPTGGTLLWSTFLAGTFGASPSAMQIDTDGSVIVAGTTPSSDFPVTTGVVGPKFLSTKSIFAPTFALTPGGMAPETGFVAKLNPSGSDLVFSTFLGGSRSDVITDLRLHNGQIYLAGSIGSEDFQGPNPRIMQECLPASFVVAMKSDGTSIGNIHVSQGSIGGLALGADGHVYTPDFAVRDLDNPPTPVYCAVDAASLKQVSAIVPGQLIALFGPDLSLSTEVGTPDAEGLLPGILNNRFVSFEGTFARLLYVSKRQVNVVVPYELAVRDSIEMEFRTLVGFFNQPGFAMRFAVVPRSPAAFQLYAPIEYCGFFNSRFTPHPYFFRPTILIHNEDGSVNSCTNPARAGSLATFFVNGGGVPAVTGAIAKQPTPVNIAATVITVTHPETAAVTLDPGSVNSVWRVQFRIPSIATAGPRQISGKIADLPVTSEDFFVWTAP